MKKIMNLLIEIIKRIRGGFLLLPQSWNSLSRAIKFSYTFQHNMDSDLSCLLIESHVLEKGITMPNMRLGFGYDRVRQVICRTNECINKYGEDHVEIQAALADLKQYKDIHEREGFALPQDINQKITEICVYLKIDDLNCYSIDKTEYFKRTKDFYEYAHQRRSLRWFADEEVEMKDILKAIDLAMTAPSACNRQSTRVKVVSNKEVLNEICSNYHNGSRGFGNKADKWLLVTSEQGAWAHDQSSSAYVDAGIFTMNLLYALHYYGIIACTLNVNLNVKQKEGLRKLIGYSESEIPVLFIAIGKPTARFMVAMSRRLNAERITTII